MKRRDQSRAAGEAQPPTKKFGFDGADHFAAIREQGIKLEILDNANKIVVDGKEMTAGEFSYHRFRWDGRTDPRTIDWRKQQVSDAR